MINIITHSVLIVLQCIMSILGKGLALQSMHVRDKHACGVVSSSIALMNNELKS